MKVMSRIQKGYKVSIYSLIDPNTKEIRYVGATAKTPERRRHLHFVSAMNGSGKFHVHRWIRKIQTEPLVVCLEVIPPWNDWQSVEKKWIAHYRSIGVCLTNMTDGGEGSFGRHLSEEHKQAVSRSRKGHVPSEITLSRLRASRARRIFANETEMIKKMKLTAKKRPRGPNGKFISKDLVI